MKRLFVPILTAASLFAGSVSSWILLPHYRSSRDVIHRQKTKLYSLSEEDAEKLRRKASQLRDEIASFEQQKASAAQQSLRQKEEEQAAAEARRKRYSAVVPILKPDGKTVAERCEFSPRWKEEGASFITVMESELPLGIILGESDLFPGTVSVDQVRQGSNGEAAGVKTGDLLRACTACRIEMTQPTWQLIVGGIGQPKTVRFMYSVDKRPFEEVMDAIASNRMDPEKRPILLVIERREVS